MKQSGEYVDFPYVGWWREREKEGGNLPFVRKHKNF
jgi:hypothetical protein